jgi:hypothetical protein
VAVPCFLWRRWGLWVLTDRLHRTERSPSPISAEPKLLIEVTRHFSPARTTPGGGGVRSNQLPKRTCFKFYIFWIEENLFSIVFQERFALRVVLMFSNDVT